MNRLLRARLAMRSDPWGEGFRVRQEGSPRAPEPSGATTLFRWTTIPMIRKGGILRGIVQLDPAFEPISIAAGRSLQAVVVPFLEACCNAQARRRAPDPACPGAVSVGLHGCLEHGSDAHR